jgi:hypothetical protein
MDADDLFIHTENGYGSLFKIFHPSIKQLIQVYLRGRGKKQNIIIKQIDG